MTVFPLKIAVSLTCIALLLARCEPNTYREGERLYQIRCANCHLDEGQGLGALIPPLAGAGDYLRLNRDKLPCILKYGLTDTITVKGIKYAESMPGVPELSAIQITNILNFVNTSWGNQQPVFQLDEVRRMLDNCPK
ncbi:MAG: c-type cytochrome [Saprospiraceae bacterium]